MEKEIKSTESNETWVPIEKPIRRNIIYKMDILLYLLEEITMKIESETGSKRICSLIIILPEANVTTKGHFQLTTNLNNILNN